MNGNYEKFRRLLEELFQLDHADLDFGIYRIMNQKRDEIMRFLDNDLLPQVQEAFREYQGVDRTGVEAELKEAIQQIKSLGMDPEASSKVKELRKQLSESVDVTKLENEVFSDLYDFFRRYYSEGDFLSLRRYKEGVYAIPYEGEEVKLHWANHDQYYVKTSEYFRDYTFKIPSGKRVHFKLVEADSEKDNQKAEAGKERRFILYEEDPLVEVDGDLHIQFEYKSHSDRAKQDALNSAAFGTIMNTSGFGGWKAELAQPMPTESNPNRTLLEKRLSDYTARNTFDYFIHKDLGGFLRRELDFYIKNEIIHLDDIENESIPRVEQYLSKIKTIRKIAHKIIEFLAQIENFQKKLWLKKRFVVEKNYCVTLGLVPEELYPEIVVNRAQHEEWVKLFAINERKDALAKIGFSEPLTTEFLRCNPDLALDTAFFSQSFKDQLLSSIDDIEEKSDGLIVHGENFGALVLLTNRYRSNVRCTYIDPPFNLDQNADYLYKTDYKDSSWLSLLFDRVTLGKSLLTQDGLTYIRCDDHGNHLVRMLSDQIFGTAAFQYELCVQRIRKNVTKQGRISIPLANDSLFLYFRSEGSTLVDPYLQLKQTRESYWRRIDDSAGFRNPPGRKIFRRNFMPYKHDAHFKYSQSSIDSMIHEGRIRLLCKKCGYEHYEGDWEGCPKCNADNPVPQYLVEATDRKILDTNWMDIPGYSSSWGFSTENAEKLLERVIKVGSAQGDLVMDYFAGSGTTMAVAHRMGRRWVGVEVGSQFDIYILPRMKTAIQTCHKSGSLFKYIRLESYEDILSNLDLKRTEEQDSLLAKSDSFRESYMLSYMLDVESNGSASLLNVNSFVDPFNYKLKIATDSAGETKPVTVDLVETFNYLLGLTVHHVDHIRGFRVVQGTTPEGGKVLVIWRDLKEKSNADLEEFFRKQEYNPRDMEFDLIYVNGDNNLENIRRPDETWKVRLIEEDFKRLMFEVEDI